jgi:poly(3-hydroxybutyrate) depolymerase
MPCRVRETLALRYRAKIPQMTQFHKRRLSLIVRAESGTNVATSSVFSDQTEGMKNNHSPETVTYKSLRVDGVTVAYREAGDQPNPKIVLLHGFPSSSHQYRNLIPALADRFHVIAPDYPGSAIATHQTPQPFRIRSTSWRR